MLIEYGPEISAISGKIGVIRISRSGSSYRELGSNNNNKTSYEVWKGIRKLESGAYGGGGGTGGVMRHVNRGSGTWVNGIEDRWQYFPIGGLMQAFELIGMTWDMLFNGYDPSNSLGLPYTLTKQNIFYKIQRYYYYINREFLFIPPSNAHNTFNMPATWDLNIDIGKKQIIFFCKYVPNHPVYIEVKLSPLVSRAKMSNDKWKRVYLAPFSEDLEVNLWDIYNQTYQLIPRDYTNIHVKFMLIQNLTGFKSYSPKNLYPADIP